VLEQTKAFTIFVYGHTTEAQGFLFEGGDDCAEVVHRDDKDEVMSGTNICYSVIGETTRVDEQLQLRRSSRMRDLYIEEEFESEEEDFEEDEDFMAEN
jgi:hypothetical protein